MKVKSKKQDRIPGIVISLILFVIECAFLVLLLYTKLISMKYIGIIAAGLLLLLVIVYFLVRKIRKTVPFLYRCSAGSFDYSSVGSGQSVYIQDSIYAG